jgi:hypothetical protein
MEFSVGEWVQRRIDGKVGVVRKAQPYNEDFVFYVDFSVSDHTEKELWAGTTQAWTRFYRLHAHAEGSSRDCDGTYTNGHVYEMTLTERCDQFGDLHFKERVLVNTVSLHGLGTLAVRPDGLSWHEQTEEGYRASEIRWCEDDCPDERSWQRDHRAEEAGY